MRIMIILLIWIQCIYHVYAGLFASGNVMDLHGNEVTREFVEKLSSKTNAIIVLNLYSASCGHCIQFSSSWKQVANVVASSCKKTVMIAVDCDENRDTCTEFEIDAVPVLLGFVPGTDIQKHDLGEPLSEELEITLRWVAKVDKTCHFGDAADFLDTVQNHSISHLNVPLEREYVESQISSKELLKREIAMAVRYGLQTGVFLGRKQINGNDLSVLLEWLNVLRQSLPGHVERMQISWLLGHTKVAANQQKLAITSGEFDKLLSEWEFARYGNQNGEWTAKWNLCSPWGDDTSSNHGGYTCALWMLFHVLTVSSWTGGASPEMTLRAIYRYVSNFFGCSECRQNFLASNPNIQKDVVAVAQHHHIPVHRALVIWLWNEHNSVTLRLFKFSPVGRSVFPSLDQCFSCYKAGALSKLRGGLAVAATEVDDSVYLTGNDHTPNGKFRDTFNLAVVSQEKFNLVSWDYDTVFMFLTHTYCFDDSRLHCPNEETYYTVWRDSFFWLASRLVGYSFLGVGIVVCVITGLKVRRMLKHPRKSRKH